MEYVIAFGTLAGVFISGFVKGTVERDKKQPGRR